MAVTVDYLDSERLKIWERIVDLQKSIDKKTSDYEKEAKQASKKCSEYRNKCESAKELADNLLKNIHTISNKITDSTVPTLIGEIKTFHANLTPQKEKIESQALELETLFSNYATYSEKLTKLESISTNADDSSAKIESTLTQLDARKKEIDQLYYEMFGFLKTDPATGVETKVAGKKEELEKTYKDLKSSFDKFSTDKKTEFDTTLAEWKTSYSASLKEINSLLPNALTTGLSYAYSKKKEEEISEIDKLKTSFTTWIVILMVISCVPFAVSAYLLVHENIPLTQVILQLSNLVTPMIGMYIPPLWIALSTNKKINLSKRLIEEYTHKEVVAKTFEGLSKQIADIKDNKVSAELKSKLLHNILEISSENPGKLISDYNNSDHPIVERVAGFLSKSKPKEE